jgi:hypothetical protein
MTIPSNPSALTLKLVIPREGVEREAAPSRAKLFELWGDPERGS